MAAPGILDPTQHYENGMSEAERKMQLMMMTAEESDDDDDKSGVVQEANNQNENLSMLSKLPIEIVERILIYSINSEIHTISNETAIQIAANKSKQAFKLCLVSRQFDQLVRPMLYKEIQLAHRRIPLLLRTLRKNSTLTLLIKKLLLDSHIWTSDVNENVIAELFTLVQSSCKFAHVGANESTLLPYLLHGKDSNSISALQVLFICWRDEVDYDPQRIRDEEAYENDLITSTSEPSKVSSRQTLKLLFNHQDLTLSSPSLDSFAFNNLEHLTLDLYSQGQLDQLFLANGFFLESILPLLNFIRIDLPITTIQCSTTKRGFLAKNWPTHRFLFGERNLEDLKETISQRNRIANSENSTSKIALANCLETLLRSLLTRFSLNVCRNDPTLFSLLLSGSSRLGEQNWSSRATCSAFLLQESLKRQLKGEKSKNSILFDLEKLQQIGAEDYWNEQWLIADQEREEFLPKSIKGENQDLQKQPFLISNDEINIKTHILCRFPLALATFLRYSAMV